MIAHTSSNRQQRGACRRSREHRLRWRIRARQSGFSGTDRFDGRHSTDIPPKYRYSDIGGNRSTELVYSHIGCMSVKEIMKWRCSGVRIVTVEMHAVFDIKLKLVHESTEVVSESS